MIRISAMILLNVQHEVRFQDEFSLAGGERTALTVLHQLMLPQLNLVPEQKLYYQAEKNS
jgi:hypothetical protein